MPTIIVTPWNSYIDIDGLACAIAYAELLRKEGNDALAVCSGNLNASIPPFIQQIAKSYIHENISWDSYVFVDVSNTQFIEKYVNLDHVKEVYDHHLGYTEFWKERLWERSKIETIGAAATLIWEEWKQRVPEADSIISKESATLLAHAILSNTVDFQLALTCYRDREAFRELEKIAKLEWNWKEHYFWEQQQYIESNPRFAIENDIKTDENFAFGQIEIWDSEHFWNSVNLEQIFQEIGHERYFMNIVDIQKGTSLIISNQPHLLEKLWTSLSISIIGNTIHLPRLMLRKEIYPIIQ